MNVAWMQPPLGSRLAPQPDAGAGVRLVESFQALTAVEPQWRRLWQQDPAATPFQSPEWLLPWCHHFARGMLMTAAISLPDGTLTGLAPLYLHTDTDSGLRKLLPLGVATSDYFDVLSVPGGGAQIAEAVLCRVRSCDVCDFQQLPSTSPLLRVRSPLGWIDRIEESDACPVLKLPEKIGHLAGCLPAKVAHNLRYYRRRAQKAGVLAIEMADEQSLEEFAAALFRLHGACWSYRGSSGVLSDEAVRQWHRDVMPLLLRAGLLRLMALRVSGRIIAAFYGLAGKGRFYYYLGGFDPEYRSLSPGTLLIGAAIERAVEEGCRQFDFLRGREDYKYLWGAKDTPTFRRLLRNRASCAVEGRHEPV